ncbi:MAG: hypothetical protein V4563_17120 [Pseudomonadota bacterium]
MAYEPTAQDEGQKKTLAEFKEKKTEYPSAWKYAYDKSKGHWEFAILGKQLEAGEIANLGLPANVKLPNLLKKYVNQQANQTLQVKYRAVVSPNGGGSDIAKARQRQDVLRGIQVPTCGPVYNMARRGQLAAGIRYSKVVVDYASNRGFEKSFRYEDVIDTYNVFPDPYVNTPTFADMDDFLIREDVPKGKWKQRTGTDWGTGSEKSRSLWYYWKKRSIESGKEYLLEDGTEKLIPDSMENPDLTGVSMMDDGVTPFARDVSIYDWEWHMIGDEGNKVIKSGDWKGCYPPLVACTGEAITEQFGTTTRKYWLPLTADAEEPQLLYSLVEMIIKMRLARSPYSKWRVAFESLITKQSEDLRTASLVGDMDIIYKAFTEDGKPIPPPSEEEPFILDRILLELQQVQIQKIEQILGIPTAVFGEKTNETSGKAIEQRKREGDVSSYHFTFNFLEYVKQMGTVTLEAFPHYYTTEQQVAFMDKDDKAVMQTINAPGGIKFDPMERYSLVVEAEPDSDTDREAEAESLMDMVENPQLGPLIMRAPGAPALVVKAQKGRYAQEIGSMLEGMANDPEKQAMQQHIQQMQQEGQKLQDQVKQLTDKNSLEYLKEQNRHDEAMRKMEIDAAKNADYTEIDAYKAETDREKVDGMKQGPESILTDSGDIEPETVQGQEMSGPDSLLEIKDF